LRIALSGNPVCSVCGFVFDRWTPDPWNSNPNRIPFALLAGPASATPWRCPSCLAAGKTTTKDKFSVGKDYLADIVSQKNIGQGLRDYVLDLDLDASTAPVAMRLEVTGAILDSWGQPLNYDLLYNEPDLTAARNRYPEAALSGKYVHTVVGQYVLFSYDGQE